MDISFNKCGMAMASSGNINGEIQLIIDVIDYKMFKGKYLVSMLSAHGIINQCDDKYMSTDFKTVEVLTTHCVLQTFYVF